MIKKITDKLKENEKLLKSEQFITGVVFSLLLLVSVVPSGVFQEGAGDVYGYTTRRSGGIVFHIPSDKDEKVEDKKEEEKKEVDKERQERINALMEKIEIVEDLIIDKMRRGELPPEAKVPTGEPYISSYIAFDGDNNPDDVVRLQNFLNRHMGANIPVTGYYDSTTMNAVKDFQAKYAEYVLEPWGISEPTGFVYLTTQRMINTIERPDQYFPMPAELRPYSSTVRVSTPTTVPSIDRGERIDDEDIEEEIIIDEDVEEDDYVWDDVMEKEEERDRSNVVAWTVIILASAGFMVVVYLLRNLGSITPKK